MATLISQIDSAGSLIYYSTRFRQMVEDHLLYIQAMPTTQIRAISERELAIQNRFQGDFYSFFNALGIERRYHWTIMRINGFRSCFDLDLSVTHFLTPDWSFIDKLAQLSKEKKK